MLYRPPRPKKMWDCTVYYEEPNYHIFYLSSGNIGHISTEDFVHYKEFPDINGFGEKGCWNQDGVPLTGTLVKTGNVYKMLLGALEPHTNQQVYGLYISDDLTTWREYDRNPVLTADGAIYEKNASPRDWWMYTAWRDPNVIAEKDGEYTLCLCARLKDHADDSTGAAVAKLKTKDFIHYEYCEPFTETGTLTKYAECPDLFETGGNRYVTFLDHSWGGLHTRTATRSNPAGTFYQIYDKAKKRFVFPDDCLLIGSANNRQCAWAARTVVGKGGKRLLYYHVTAEFPSFGIPKEIAAKKDGTLFLKYFAGMDGLYGMRIPLQPCPIANDGGHWVVAGNNFRGKAGIYGSALPVAEAENFIFDGTVSVNGGDKAGIACWHTDSEEAGAAVVWLDFANRRITAAWEHYREYEGFGDFQSDVVNGGMIRERDEKQYGLAYGVPYRLKIIARDSTLDVYIDGEWVLCKRFSMCGGRHKISLTAERAEADFADVQLHTCKELHVQSAGESTAYPKSEKQN